jgi:rifampicin phosphotransferase
MMTTVRTDQVLPLAHVGLADAARAGRKAAVLGELRRAGFPVPDGFVLTAGVLGDVLAAAGLGEDARPEQVDAAGVPAGVADLLAAAAARLGPSHLLAVRSSGVAEDLPGASYAGQYETVLGVSAADLPVAVRRCWASAFADHLRAYRGRHGGGPPGADLAVLVQPLVAAEAAGVAFSADPVTGDRDTVVVSAVRGLGDRLVAGSATPDEWVVRDGTAVCRGASEGALDEATALAVADLTRRVQALLGEPQDVEWALAGGRLVLLQARPITALPEPAPAPVPVPVEVPAGFWQREASHAPKPWTPMTLSTSSQDARNSAVRTTFAEFGLLAETLEWRQIGGWEYTRLVPLGGKDRPAPPRWVMALLVRAVPRLRRRVADSVAAIRSDKPGQLVDRWYGEWRPDLTRRIEQLRDRDLAALGDDDLDAHAADALRLVRVGTERHFLLHGALTMIIGELAFTTRDLLGASDEQTLDLLTGLSATSTEPARRLAELARFAADRPEVRRELARLDTTSADRLAATDPEFAAAFAAYQHEFACRALRYEIADPCMAETPELTLRLLADQLARGYDPDREQEELAGRRGAAVARARAALAGHPPAERERLERALARAERAYPVREENEFHTISAPLALLRYAVLEFGRRLAGRGQLRDRDDVFFLTLDEARAALRDGADRASVAGRRKAERAWVLQHPGPPTYGKDPGPPPALDVLPAEARFAMEAMLWYVERILAPEPSGQVQAAGARSVTGLAASGGTYTGPVRVVMDESEFGKLHPGDVLVCPVTSPVWSVLFPSVGALVTDTGGLLSHPAIIAREHGVPAVVATGNATSLLQDGQVVTVDGTSGRILL